MAGYSVHTERLSRILREPPIIGIDDLVLWSAQEMKLRRRNSKDLVGEADAIIKTLSSGLYVVEYKCGYDHRERALKQLFTVAGLVSDYFGEKPRLLYVHGKHFATEEIK